MAGTFSQSIPTIDPPMGRAEDHRSLSALYAKHCRIQEPHMRAELMPLFRVLCVPKVLFVVSNWSL